MYTIAIINLKGGTGKTTTTVELAAELGIRHKKRVLVIDNDKQGNTSQFMQEYEPTRKCGMAKILETGSISTAKRYWNSGTMRNYSIDIIDANMSLQTAEEELRYSEEVEQEKKAFRLTQALTEDMQNTQEIYDYCIIDNPPALSLTVLNALAAADVIIIPVNLDNYSLDGLETITEQIDIIKEFAKKPELNYKILITDYEKCVEAETAEKWLRDSIHGKHVIEGRVRHTKRAKVSTFYKQPLILFSPRSGASKDYRRIAQEIREKVERGGDNANV